MSQIALSGNASGTGVLTIASPNTNTNYTQTLPTAAGTFVVGSSGVSAVGQIPFSTDGSTYTPTAKIVSGTAVASTSGTSIDFTSIPSWVKRITVMFNGVSTNGTSPPQIQIGSGSVTTSGYLGTNSIITDATFPSCVLFTTGFGIGVSTGNWATGVIVHGAITLTLQTGSTWVSAGSVGRSDFASTYFTNGSLALGGALDRVRITTVNGTNTFDAGSINLLWE